MEISFDLNDLKPDALRRMLREAMLAERKKPSDKESDDEEEEETDNDKLVDLHEERGDPKAPSVTPEDLPEEGVEKAAKERKKSKARKA